MKANAFVTVYMEFVNYRGEVTDRQEIARFFNKNWAEIFINNLPKDDDGLEPVRYVVEDANSRNCC